MPAASRPIDASFAVRPMRFRVACFNCDSRSATASAMASMAPHNTPISPGGRMPTRANRSPSMTLWDMVMIRPMGRSTSLVTKKISIRLVSVVKLAIARNMPTIVLSLYAKGASSRPT